MSAQDLSQLDDVLALLTGGDTTSSTSKSTTEPNVTFQNTPTVAGTTASHRDEESQQRQPRPTIAALDAFMSNLNSAFDSLEVGGKSGPTDELSSTIFNLSSVVPKEREQCLLKLVNLSVDENQRAEILRRDGVRSIVELLSIKNEIPMCRLAAQAIANLALNESCRNEVGKVGGVPKLVNVLKETRDDDLIGRSLSAVSNLCNNHQLNRTKFAEAGLLDVLTNILATKPSSSPLVGRTLTATINLIFDEETQRKVVNSNLLKMINSFMASNEGDLKTQAIWIFAVLSTGPGDVQDGIIKSGGLDLLVKQIPSSTSEQLDKILTALVNISNNEDILESIQLAGGIKHLVNIIKESQYVSSSRLLAAQTLNNLSFNDKCTQKIGDEGGAKAVVDLLKWSSEKKERALEDIALRTIVNLAFSPVVRKQLNENNAQSVISATSSSSENASLALQNLRVPS